MLVISKVSKDQVISDGRGLRFDRFECEVLDSLNSMIKNFHKPSDVPENGSVGRQVCDMFYILMGKLGPREVLVAIRAPHSHSYPPNIFKKAYLVNNPWDLFLIICNTIESLVDVVYFYAHEFEDTFIEETSFAHDMWKNICPLPSPYDRVTMESDDCKIISHIDSLMVPECNIDGILSG